MTRVVLMALGALLFSAAPGWAQGGFRPESASELGVQYRVYDKLKSVPLQLGRTAPNMKARFEPTTDSDYIYGSHGKAKWYLRLRAFDRVEAGKTGEETGPAKTAEEAMRRARAAREAKSFEEFVREKDQGAAERTFLLEGKVYKKKGSRPAYTLWEHYDVQEGRSGEFEWFTISACYDIDGKDVVLECQMPAKKKHKPDTKWYGIAKKMVTSLVLKEQDEDDGGNEDKDKFADTPAKKEALAAAKKNIEDLKSWSYFTLPDYIILYSWDPEKGSRGRRDSTNFAKTIGKRIQEIRELFEETYPPDGKTFPYSIIRVCSTYAEFSNYGSTSGGVVGWFSPGTKELVVFDDTEKRFSGLDVVKVCYHEAWHQYSDSFWPSVELHRWFDEGLAEYFAQYEKKGRSWRRETHNGRFRSIRDQIGAGNYIPVKDIVYWSRAKFYGARAPDHYAQAYSMADFILRGKKKLGRRWDDKWDGILKRYGDVCLEDQNPKKASDVAFEDIDYEAFTEAWIMWVTKHLAK